MNNPFNTFGNIIPGSQLNRTKGLRGAKEYPVPPNTVAPIFDEDENILYIKSVDQNNYASVRRYGLTELEDEPVQNGMVSEKEFQAFKEEVLDGQRSIQSILESFQTAIDRLQSNAANVHNAGSSKTVDAIDAEFTTVEPTTDKPDFRKNKWYKGNLQHRSERERSSSSD